MTNRKLQYWVIPPAADAEFVAAMEAVLDTYEKAYDPDHPVLCMDEQPVQLVRETRRPIPATKRHARRVDYEYERAGTASIFMFTEPLAGWREATARASRTKRDWAVEVARLLEGRYRQCSTVTLVCDNLNTHTIGAFYEAFPPARARALVRRLCPHRPDLRHRSCRGDHPGFRDSQRKNPCQLNPLLHLNLKTLNGKRRGLPQAASIVHYGA